MTTLGDLIDEIQEYLQLGKFSGVSRKRLVKYINAAFEWLWPRVYVIYDYTKRIDENVPADYSVELPQGAKTVVEVTLCPPGEIAPGQELKGVFRMTAFSVVTAASGNLELRFDTKGWKGTLRVIGEAVVRMSDDEPHKVFNVNATEPVVHYVASLYYSSLANSAMRDGDTQRYQAVVNASGRELQLAEYTAQRVRMPRMVPRVTQSVDKLRREAAAKYSLGQDLPVK